MALVFDHIAQRIKVISPQTVILIQDLVDACRLEEETNIGIVDSQIISAAGKEILGAGVQVGITATLLNNWQLEFWPGNYTATISGGNIVSATGDPVAYVLGGPQVEITLSAAATITAGGGGGSTGPTAIEIAQAVRAELSTELGRIDAAVSTRESSAAADIRATTSQAEHDATQAAIDNIATIVELTSLLSNLPQQDPAVIATAVWAYMNRSLTTPAGLTTDQNNKLNAIKVSTDKIPTNPATEESVQAAKIAAENAVATNFI